MPLVTATQMLRSAQAGHYAVGAFNVENMEMVQAVIAAAEELRAPVMLQTTPSTVRYGGVGMYAAMVRARAEEASVPVALHLDHGDSLALCAQALRGGYTSIMIDGSHLSFEDNVAVSARVVEMCAPNLVPVEAELGMVGGKEDDLESAGDIYTDPELARQLVERTGITALAVAIGTAHGLYAGVPQLDIQRLREIRKIVSIPLVLHGASGLLDEQVRECIGEGICKVNFATELRVAYSEGVRELLGEKPDAFDPKAYGARGRAKVTELVKNRMRVCGCDGKA